MSFFIDIQQASKIKPPVTEEELESWVTQSLIPFREKAELTLRMVNVEEMTQLNHEYRQINKPTNVLSFPLSYPENIALDVPLLGDVIVCPEILKQESEDLNTPLTAHWAHIVIHGVLHLLGYDHIKDDEAAMMQTIEIQMLANLGFDNPYLNEGHSIE